MANTAKQDSTKDDKPKAAQADNTGSRSDAARESRAREPQDVKDREPKTDAEPTPSDQVRADEEALNAAMEENPEHPEEALPTQYLEGGEIPANAPGTEGMARA